MKNNPENTGSNINEMHVADAFTLQAAIFDATYSSDGIIEYKRKRVRAQLTKYLIPRSFVLELNSGTGEDALWLARQNHKVHATDISRGMQQVMQQKIRSAGLENTISYETCSFTRLENLQQKGPFDMILSNFAGLNCSGDIKKVLSSFTALLKPKGIVTLVILPRFCLWEFLLIFKGKFKTATRRFFSKYGRYAQVEDHAFKCWYYNPSDVTRHLKKDFDLLDLEGLCSLVPPSYIKNFAEKYPRLFSFLCKKEDAWKNYRPWKYIGDYYIISLQKKSL